MRENITNSDFFEVPDRTGRAFFTYPHQERQKKICRLSATLSPEPSNGHQNTIQRDVFMGQIRIDSTRRYECAHLICAYLVDQKMMRAEVTSHDIARFHHLSRKASQSISAMLNFLYTNHIRESRFGFLIRGTTPLSKCNYPHHFTIELINEGKGLL